MCFAYAIRLKLRLTFKECETAEHPQVGDGRRIPGPRRRPCKHHRYTRYNAECLLPDAQNKARPWLLLEMRLESDCFCQLGQCTSPRDLAAHCCFAPITPNSGQTDNDFIIIIHHKNLSPMFIPHSHGRQGMTGSN